MGSFRIPTCEHKCEVKCFHCVLEELFSAKGNALGYIASQGRPNADRLCQELVNLKVAIIRPAYLTLSAS
jgi:hypothetical protein